MIQRIPGSRDLVQAWMVIQNERREISSGHSPVPLLTYVQAKQPGCTEVGSNVWPTGPSQGLRTGQGAPVYSCTDLAAVSHPGKNMLESTDFPSCMVGVINIGHTAWRH